MAVDLVALEARARERLDRDAYDYYAGGADDEVTLADNVAAWARLRLRPHMLRDVSAVDLATTVLGVDVAMPVLVAPTAYHAMSHPDGEAATARAAARVGTLMQVSTLATVALEDVAKAAPDAPRFFQLYVHRDRGLTEEHVARAVDAGYRAIVLTVDAPFLGRRPRDERNRFSLPDGLMMANMGRSTPDGEEVGGSGLAAYFAQQLDPTLTEADVEWLAGLSDLPVVVKGVLRGDDARRAVDAGAAAVQVSNHGGRQLDTAIATADALGEVVAAVGDRAEVYVDGGVRRGTDVLKAVALGARAALVGRPVLWGLAAGGDGEDGTPGGEDGVVAVLESLREQLALAMALSGCATLADVTRDLLAQPHP